jgi:hypothetical protein
MAQIEMIDALLQYLHSVDELTAEVSVDSATDTFNIRPSVVTQGTETPYITIELIADDSSQQLDGVTCYIQETYNITIFSTSSLTNAKIASILKRNLDGFQQRLLPPSKTLEEGAIWVGSTRKTNGFEIPNSPQAGDQRIVKGRTEVYDISFAIPDNVVHPANTT